jgi:hypothetical protein
MPKRKKRVSKSQMKAGKIKFSTYMKGISSVAGIASSFPILTPVTLPVATISGGIGGIAQLMGKGFTQKELNKTIKNRRKK